MTDSDKIEEGRLKRVKPGLSLTSGKVRASILEALSPELAVKYQEVGRHPKWAQGCCLNGEQQEQKPRRVKRSSI